jgi:repressor of nif and glnA expression
VRIAVDSESVMDPSAVIDNSDTADSLIVENFMAIVVDKKGYSVSSKIVLETDESDRDFKVTEKRRVCMTDCVINTDSLDCDKITVLGCTVDKSKVAV